MAWVTLSLRKQELIRQHNDLEMEDLRITREERRMQREYSYEEMLVNDDAQKQLRSLRTTYDSAKETAKAPYTSKQQEYQEAVKAYNDAYAANPNDPNLTTLANDRDTKKAAYESESTTYQDAITQAKEDYEAQKNDLETNAEDESAMLEEEANMIETQLEEEKTKIETQMEAVSQEMQAIKEQISTDIQNSVISLK